MKKRLIFAYYSNKATDFGLIDFLHFSMINIYKDRFNEHIICILTDDVDDLQYIENLKETIKRFAFDNKYDPEYVILKNDSLKREGKAYKELIYDNLDELDGLTMFAHTKGKTSFVSNDLALQPNMHKWIYYCWFGCLNWFIEDEQMIDDLGEYVTYGSLYMYDPRLNELNYVNNNWIYSGSFHWLNCHKISKYIKDNNVNLDIYNEELCGTHYIRQIAENFVGNVIVPDYAAYHGCKNMNSEYPALYDIGIGLSYSNVDMIPARTLPAQIYFEYVNSFAQYNENIISKLKNSLIKNNE